MTPFFEKALVRFHEIADLDKDGKITKQDAQIVLGQLQHEAGIVTARATPLGALLACALAGLALGILAGRFGAPWIF